MIKTYSDEDIKGLLNFYKGNNYLDVRNKTMIMILVETGIRNSELRGIKLDDIFDDVIRIHGKGNKVRFVPISIHLKKQLAKYLRVRNQYEKAKECPYLIVSTRGSMICLDMPLHALKQAGKNLDIDVQLLIHSIRRYYIQTMANKVDLYSLSRIVGHSDLKITQIYLQSMEDKTVLERVKLTSPLSNM